ncbi:E3 ubiquitin-protein ligase SP1-like isoform X2 [Prunus persica]|uniref:E3 ubiquitin-protein ligase SP1-like isoform X2 n=1 Tax=Prunus persica TaxID=3760 RepID=UPI0009AB3EF3|nr:E3 ubiquitin-protein ligase SP1-like isoform X2 [Prunus persica]
MPKDGILSCLGGGALYLLGWFCDSDADNLQSALRIRKLKDLERLLRYEHRLVVAIRGKVFSETPINCELSGLQGVVVEQREEQYFLKRIKDDEWMKDYKFTPSTTKEVPWYLDDGTFRVNVVGARRAGGFEYPAENAVFEGSKRSWPQIETLAFLKNLPLITKGKKDHKILGVKRIERVLPVGTSLSVVGEAVKDGNGTISIREPYRRPFYVSPKTIDQLTEESRMWARLLYVASFGFIVYGGVQIAKHSI